MFTDEVTIRVKAGNGGNGCVSLHREKYQPKGGPDGGDGGNGGDVIFQASNDVNTLTFFDARKEFKAQNGVQGGKNRCHGKNAEDLILNVPPGTIIYKVEDDKSIKIADLVKEGERAIVATGGRGGWGNMHFATPTHQTPMEANPGTPGEDFTLKLELRIIADVGFIGLPNSGKSTLLSRISAARPKIANYPFTTLEPNLGVVRVDNKFSFIAADIPGLIEGASKGKGLGIEFLRHVKRTKSLVHIIDITSADLMLDYNTIRAELKLFDKELAEKHEILVLNKIDLLGDQKPKIPAKMKKLHPILISAVSGKGIDELLYKIKELLTK